ncbi:MAG: protein TonB [Planctomycetota bacterium]|jgi:protein TonB
MAAVAQGIGRAPRSTSKLVAQGLAALLLAALLNIILVQSILFLNRAAAARAPEIAAQQRLQILELPPLREAETVEDMEVQEPLEALMQVDLDAPTIELEQLELPELSFDLELSLTSLGGTSVQVQSRVAVHSQAETEAQSVAPQQEGPLDSDAVDQPPRELASSPKPEYPRAAQRRRIEGVVAIELLIDENGRVLEHRNPIGEALLVQAVLKIVPALRFSPARNNGSIVAVWGRKTFRFQLPPRR